MIAGALAVRGAFVLGRADAASRNRLLAPLAGVASLIGLAVWLDEARLFLLLPVGISVLLGLAFGRTLFGPDPTMVETFARLQVGELPDDEVRYCRRLTVLWCAFFAANAAVAAWLALRGSVAQWALYTGIVSYALIGSLLVGEMVYRYWRFRRYAGAFSDRFFRPFFPPRDDARSRAASYGSAPER
jgi:uncharacterized membrane protein